MGRHVVMSLAFLSGMLCAATLPTPRMVPVDPLLSEVDAQSGRLTFYYVGALADGVAESAHEVVATVDGGNAVRAKLGEDRRATVAFGALAEGAHDIEVALSAPGGTMLCRHRYGITARTKRAKAVGRRLNNFVTEILDAPLTDGEVTFENPREGWVFIGFDKPYAAAKAYLDGGVEPVVVFRPDEPSETMRWLEEGTHKVRVTDAAAGGRLAIRLVKPLKITARSFAKETTDIRVRNQGYGFDFFRKWIFGSFNILTMGGNWRLASAKDRMAWGNAQLLARGKGYKAASDIRPGNLELRASLEKMRGYVTGSAAYRDGLPLEVDEHKVNAPAEEMDAFAEATWEMVADGKGMAMFADYCDLPGQPLTNLQSQVSALSAVMNTGNGHGMLVPEMYLATKRTERDAEAEVDRVLAYVESIRRAIPSGPSHIIHLFGGWLTIGEWSSDSSPEADVKVRYDRYLHRLATDPAFADVGGVGMSTLACDEEIARWMARIVHHYCIEGRTDSLAEKLGYRYRPEIVTNGDFMDGLKGWTAEPAAPDAIREERRIGYGGKKGQCRMARSDTEIGEHFAVFTRAEKAPNRLSQPIGNLVPGKLYMLTFCTADYDDVIAPGTREVDRTFSVSIEGVETLPELSWDVVVPDAKAIRKARKAGLPVHCVTVTHRIVFRAQAATGRLTFFDWKGPTERGGPVGGRQLLNFVRIAPYFPMADECTALPTRGMCGHQGDPQNFPGNTVESLMSAVQKGVAMVEFDLQRCKSGEFVLFHDETLGCLFTEEGRGTGRIRDYTLAELKSRFWVGRTKKCRLATFDEVLAVLPRSDLWINVHCYVGKGYVAEIARKIVADGRKHQAFVCGSLGQIREARRAVPDIMACNMSRPGPRNRDWTEEENRTYALDTVTNGCQFLQLCRRWPAKFSQIVHDGGGKVNFFRSDSPDEIEGLLSDGVDFILTNRPGEMVPRFRECVK